MNNRSGYEITSSSTRAVEHLNEAVRLTTSLGPGAADAYKACLLEEPNLALAHAGLSFTQHLDGQGDPARESFAAARSFASSGNRREQRHIEVVGAFSERRPSADR